MAYLGLFLFFTTISLSAIITNENLRDVKLSLVNDIQIGQSPLPLKVIVENNGQKECLQIEIEGKKMSSGRFDLKAVETINTDVFLHEEVGVINLNRLRLISSFPFGLFQSWKNFSLKQTVYLLPVANNHRGEYLPGSMIKDRIIMESGDFHTFIQTDRVLSPNEIDWKKYAQWGILFGKKYDSPHLLQVEITDFDLKGLNTIEKMEQILYWAEIFDLMILKLEDLEETVVDSNEGVNAYLKRYMDKHFEIKNI